MTTDSEYELSTDKRVIHYTVVPAKNATTDGKVPAVTKPVAENIDDMTAKPAKPTYIVATVSNPFK